MIRKPHILISFSSDQIYPPLPLISDFQHAPNSLIQERRVTSYDVGPQQMLTIPGLLRHLHDCSQAHASSYDAGYLGLQKIGLAWALVCIDLQWGAPSPPGEHFMQVGTSVNRAGGPVVYRDYWATHDEAPFIAGQSMWALIDLQTRSTATTPAELRAILKTIASPLVKDVQAKRLPAGEVLPIVDRREVRLHDCDFNGHLNNTITVQWMMDGLEKAHRLKGKHDTLVSKTQKPLLDEVAFRLSPKALNLGQPQRLRVSYHSEALLGEELSIGIEGGGQQEELKFGIELRGRDGRLIANAMIWL